jgi:hypothetical protein
MTLVRSYRWDPRAEQLVEVWPDESSFQKIEDGAERAYKADLAGFGRRFEEGLQNLGPSYLAKCHGGRYVSNGSHVSPGKRVLVDGGAYVEIDGHILDDGEWVWTGTEWIVVSEPAKQSPPANRRYTPPTR